MAPTVSEFSDQKGGYTLEDYLQRTLRLSHSDGVNCSHSIRKSQHKTYRLTCTKILGLMGLVVDQAVREGDSPGLPSSNSDHRTSLHMDIPRKEKLINITLRTMALLRRNQQLQRRLTALQQETQAFVQSSLNHGGSIGSGHHRETMSIDQ